MSDYKQSTITGTKWTRTVRANIENPLNGTPGIFFAEEEVINIREDSSPITRLMSNVSISFSDPALEIPLRDVSTWELTGETITAGSIYQAIASLYWKLAIDRDNAQANQKNEEALNT